MAKPKPPIISIIIPTRTRTDLLQNLVASLERHCPQPHYEIIVVYTGAADAMPPALLDLPERYTLVLQYDATFAQGVNEGARRASGKYLLLLNDDVVLTQPLFDGLALPGDAIVGCRLLYPDGLIQHAGVGFDQSGNPYHLWRYAPSMHPFAVQRRLLPAVTFASVLTPRHIWDALGGLDEGYRNAYEDIDFCLRAHERGYPVLYEPGECAVHLESQTPGRNDCVQESQALFQQRWVHTGRLWYALGMWPVRVERG